LTADATTITVNGWHNPWSTTAPADPLDGYHTFRLDFATPPLQAPEGIAHGSLTITPDGKTTITDRSADGTAFTCKAHTSTTGQILLYA
ncbi:hypothetical protein, partial [Streptococcus pneumoniae]|uniref:hypothetical protein n=1 Tax=Streptococcus pneumoniae TaxID=1313 RepID=UPI0018B0666B